MKDLILKWWNREWSNWELDHNGQDYFTLSNKNYYIVLKRTSNDGLIQFKKIYKAK